MTVEHNTLAPGSIGHIARHREIDVSGYEPPATDRWFHYDQVGSVMVASNASGTRQATFHPDAFGNMMADWETGLWTNSYTARENWGHNTKELDGDTGLVYMFQRWYFPETGLFISVDQFQPVMTQPATFHHYQFVHQRPTSWSDPTGLHGDPIPLPITPDLGLPTRDMPRVKGGVKGALQDALLEWLKRV